MKRAVLPCNGLDKQFGVLAREMGLRLLDTEHCELICPVLLGNSPARYEKALAESPLLIIDGCSTRCASKLANKLELKIDSKVLVSEEAKASGFEISESLKLGPVGMQLVDVMIKNLAKENRGAFDQKETLDFDSPTDFITVTHDKYIFNIPAEGYLFNENDCWVRLVGNKARVGVSDYVQQNLTDITYFEPAKVEAEIEQFDEIGSIESGKSMMDVLSPVSGKIAAVNTQLVDSPELINEDPYGKGWVAEIDIRDFDADKELLLDAEAYSEVVKKKAMESLH